MAADGARILELKHINGEWRIRNSTGDSDSYGSLRKKPLERDLESYFTQYTAPTQSTILSNGIYLDYYPVEGCPAVTTVKLVSAANSGPNLTRLSGASSLSINGTSISLSIRVVNDGNETAGSSTVKYFLSTNTSITESDTEIGSDFVSSLAPGANSLESINVDACDFDLPDGEYFVGYEIDFNNDVEETDESDNGWYFSSSKVTIENGNLKMSSRDLSITNNQINISLRVLNEGPKTVSSSMVRYYVSTNTTITKFDTEIGADFVRSLSANSYSDETFSRDLESLNLPNGEYYVGYIIDADDDATESNENDNTGYWSTPKFIEGGCPDELNISNTTILNNFNSLPGRIYKGSNINLHNVTIQSGSFQFETTGETEITGSFEVSSGVNLLIDNSGCN